MLTTYKVKIHSPPRPIIILDICTISHIKERENIGSKGDSVRERLDELSEMAKSGQYRFSLLLAIIEKGTDYTHVLNAEELIDIIKSDYAQIIGFLGSNNMVEPREALEKLIPILMDPSTPKESRAELSIPASLELLDFFNRELRVYQTPSRNIRLQYAERVVAEGERLGLKKGHPAIAMCIASIYGCEEARNILKISKDVNDFNPSNALGDIQSFYRIAYTRFSLEKKYPGARVEFRTSDAALEDIHTWFKTRVTSITDEGTLMNTTIEAPEKLLPALYKKGECLDQTQLTKIYALMDYNV